MSFPVPGHSELSEESLSGNGMQNRGTAVYHCPAYCFVPVKVAAVPVVVDMVSAAPVPVPVML